jgi:hypothetical protein
MDSHKLRIMEVSSRNTLMTNQTCIEKWGEKKGNEIFDKMVREVMRWNGVGNKDIHTPFDGNSFQSEESPTPFLNVMKI